MFFKFSSILALVISFIYSCKPTNTSTIQSNINPDIDNSFLFKMSAIPYNQTTIGKFLSREQLIGLLNNVAKNEFGKAFINLGDPLDFYHGHLLFDSNREKPHAILYHTQEEVALLVDENNPLRKLNHKRRNLLQTINNPNEVYDAYNFLREINDKEKEQYSNFLEADTVPPKLIDQEKLARLVPGVVFDLSDNLEFGFFKVACERDDTTSRVIEIKYADTSTCVTVHFSSLHEVKEYGESINKAYAADNVDRGSLIIMSVDYYLSEENKY